MCAKVGTELIQQHVCHIAHNTTWDVKQSMAWSNLFIHELFVSSRAILSESQWHGEIWAIFDLGVILAASIVGISSPLQPHGWSDKLDRHCTVTHMLHRCSPPEWGRYNVSTDQHEPLHPLQTLQITQVWVALPHPRFAKKHWPFGSDASLLISCYQTRAEQAETEN